MPTSDERTRRSEAAAVLTRLFEQAYLQHEARQQQVRTEIGLSRVITSTGPGHWGLGYASLDALAKFAGYPDLSSAFDRLVLLDGGAVHKIDGVPQQPKGNAADG